MNKTMHTTEEYLLPRLSDSLSTWEPANKASVAWLAETCFCETSIKGNTCKFLFLLQNIFMLYLLLTSGAIMGDHRHCHFEGFQFPMASIYLLSLYRQPDDSKWDENMKHHKVMTTSLRQRNYCHSGKNTRGQHMSPGRVNLGTF